MGKSLNANPTKGIVVRSIVTGFVFLFTLNSTGSAQVLQQIKTVFVIPLENHDWVQGCPTCGTQQILGNPAAPYVNSLITPGNSNAVQVSYATKYYSVNIAGEHPSEPNYVWSEAGTDFGVHTDNDPKTSSGNLFTCQHLCGQLTAAGIAWKSYQEDLEYTTKATVSANGTRPSGTNIYNGSKLYNYAVKHNPMEFFTDTTNKNVYSMTQLWTDLTNNAVGRYNWITPDMYNEMHSYLSGNYTYHGTNYSGDQASIAEGDNCLSIIIPKIMASAAYQDHGVIIIWTDETESTDDTNTTLPYIIISPLAKGNAYASTLPYSHSSDLKTMDEIFGLAYQTNAIPAGETNALNTGYNYVDGRSAPVNDLSDMFQPQCAPVISWSFTNLTLNAVSNCSAAMIDVTGTNYILATDTCSGSVLTITQTPTSNTLLAAGTTNQVVITVTDSTGSAAYSTNWIVVADVTAPVIVNQPASLTNNAGMSASFNVGAMACTQLSYQWYFGTALLDSETNSTLSIASVGPANVGSYYVLVTSAGGSTNSDLATLTVIYQVPNIVGGQMMLGGNGFQLTFSGPSGQTYQVLASDDMTVPRSAWMVIGSGTFGSTNVIFTDPDATNHTSRFYIIKSP